MSGASLTNLAILLTERESEKLVDEIDFDNVISKFAARKVQKIHL